MWDVGGTATDEPIKLAHEQYVRRHRRVLVCLRKLTDFGNVYTVPAQWCDRIVARSDGTYTVTADGTDYVTDARGKVLAEGGAS
jgi:hypothetical protein